MQCLAGQMHFVIVFVAAVFLAGFDKHFVCNVQ